MKQRLIFLLSIIVPLMVSTGVIAHAAADSKIEQTLRQLEDERVEALVAGDIVKLERLFADDLTYTHATGVIQTKAEFLADLKSGKRAFKSMKHSDVQVRVYGPTGVLTGRSDYRFLREGQETDISVRFTEIFYKNRNGLWQMVAWQSTRVPQ